MWPRYCSEFMLSQISITGLYHFYGTLSTIQTIHLIQIKGVPKLLDLWIRSQNNETDDKIRLSIGITIMCEMSNGLMAFTD